jgi:hypothetical protein
LLAAALSSLASNGKQAMPRITRVYLCCARTAKSGRSTQRHGASGGSSPSAGRARERQALASAARASILGWLFGLLRVGHRLMRPFRLVFAVSAGNGLDTPEISQRR